MCNDGCVCGVDDDDDDVTTLLFIKVNLHDRQLHRRDDVNTTSPTNETQRHVYGRLYNVVPIRRYSLRMINCI